MKTKPHSAGGLFARDINKTTLMHLIRTSKVILNQLQEFIDQLRDKEYRQEMEVLEGNSIGKHVRHVLEFFDMLVSGHASGIVNYDERKRDLLLESSRAAALSKICVLTREINNLDLNEPLELQADFTVNEGENVALYSSVGRELAYNIEHAIHHMAIMKIAAHAFSSVQLPANFGVAFSSVRHRRLLSEK